MADVDGIWEVTLHEPQGEVRCTVTLVSAEPRGTMVASDRPAVEMLGIVIDGTRS